MNFMEGFGVVKRSADKILAAIWIDLEQMSKQIS